MNRIHLYFRSQPATDRFFPGDRYIIPALRKLIKGNKVSGIEKVFINLCKGFDELSVDYDINLPFKKIQPGEPAVVLGNGRYALQGYHQPNPVIAGIGLMTHPSEWPGLFTDYPVAKYLQHSVWANNVYIPYYGTANCEIWPAGVNTGKWAPSANTTKKYDILVYDKIMWDKDETRKQLKAPILEKLNKLGLSYAEITYGDYKEAKYFDLLQQSKAMIFLCEHESQGFACCEAMATNVPVFAWNKGQWLDPNRFAWGETEPVPASSIPFFDTRCGMQFKNMEGFEASIDQFWHTLTTNGFKPREYILENITLKKSAQKMLDIINSVYS
ncbi:glycosyltransferase family 1 protein [Mucilaginibacter sp. RB4R14]|uniref:glycosyltransferase family 1 protein n=1 Tax=Mucilaginibacter aurantiaciroseus TaxID=2949308 RepID=UPI00209072BD|nr:glycosyltransferase family 1 protein [Mucilaginibacter aurantiaciroseus]MCO5936059.1 glycosyltransferase family 1 protein [Mucilaginibacter aurantiaciroseus]